jgi:hypothetical protein
MMSPFLGMFESRSKTSKAPRIYADQTDKPGFVFLDPRNPRKSVALFFLRRRAANLPFYCEPPLAEA